MIAAAVVVFAFVALCVGCAVYDAVTTTSNRPTGGPEDRGEGRKSADRPSPTLPHPRPESFSERHDRLDAEAVSTPDLDGNVAWFDGRGVTR